MYFSSNATLTGIDGCTFSEYTTHYYNQYDYLDDKTRKNIFFLISNSLMPLPPTQIFWSLPKFVCNRYFQDGCIDYNEFVAMMQKGNTGAGAKKSLEDSFSIGFRSTKAIKRH